MAEIEALSELIYGGQQAELIALLDTCERLNGQVRGGYGLLHIAAKVGGSEATIRALVACGASLELRDDNGNTPLMVAANYGRTANVREVLKCGADSSAVDAEGWSALHKASSGRHEECVHVLLAHGADPDAGMNRDTPLVRCIRQHTDLRIEMALLDRGAKIDAGDGAGTPLMAAIAYKNHTVARFLLGRGAHIAGPTNGAGESTLEFAQRVGDPEMLVLLQV